MDIRHDHGTLIHVVRACDNADAPDLIAIGGESSVSVLLITDTSANLIASFHIGSRITALAWSPRAVSPSSSDQWLIELTTASSDFGLHLLTKSPDVNEDIFPFGGGLSGHHGPVNEMTFCGGPTDDFARYVATVSDDKMLMVWDLHPIINIPSALLSPSPSDASGSPSTSRLQPTAYVISFPHALSSVCAHASTTKDLLVADVRGSLALIDWRSDPSHAPADAWHHPRVAELAAPRAIAGGAGAFPASAAWQQANPDIIGAVHRSRFSLWDLSKLQGGKPTLSGASFPEGAHRFRWCPTYPEYFAISTRSPSARGATIHPTAFTLAPRPLCVRDFDFVPLKGIPRIAAAVGHELIVFYIGVE
ncbi:hypothetical protein B0F90DRAFT_1711156 [Multifurca ochricompacta]|uniref:Uncharacterized protein n=1 Tax=Multifurca ochricompacta TaxID=376703 RepID=A0AAD4M8C5_9AGAM|nr:hypothetical protein B0F90DRAFT_1711156 [Multifurca ochricompacta]